MPEVWIPVIVTAIGGIVVEFVRRNGAKGSREISLINELQEELERSRTERDRDRERFDALSAKVDEMSVELSTLKGRDFLWRWHVGRQDEIILAVGGDPLKLPPELQETP